jgi:hypothetical protein
MAARKTSRDLKSCSKAFLNEGTAIDIMNCMKKSSGMKK